jgi:hypothetical protein
VPGRFNDRQMIFGGSQVARLAGGGYVLGSRSQLYCLVALVTAAASNGIT